MTGNYWETKRFFDDKPLERKPAPKPWVSPTGDESSPEYKKALLVRQALAHAIDREELVASVMEGLGGPNYFAYMPPTDHPAFKKGKYVFDPNTGKGSGGWEIPYDPKFAKELLTMAGYPNGFKMENVWSDPPGTAAYEMIQAVAGVWKADLNVEVTHNTNVYSTYRPGLVQRTTSEPFVGCGDDSNLGVPFDWARGFVMSSWSDGGYGVGMEVRWAAENYANVAKELDKNKRIQMNTAFVQRGIDSALCIGTVMDPGFEMYDPKVIASWEQLPTIEGGLNRMNNWESIVLTK
jgi:peptide/nickel transport system substrate-binding protein